MVYIDVGQEPRLRTDLRGRNFICFVPSYECRDGKVIELTDEEIVHGFLLRESTKYKAHPPRENSIKSDSIFSRYPMEVLPIYQAVPVMDSEGNPIKGLRAITLEIFSKNSEKPYSGSLLIKKEGRGIQ